MHPGSVKRQKGMSIRAQNHRKAKYKREFLKDFIAHYRTHPCLWKYSSPDYRNKNARDKAHASLAQLMRSKYGFQADKKIVQEKINSMRSVFRKEYIRRQSNAGKPDDKSMVWYYDLLKFVVEEQSPRRQTHHRKTLTGADGQGKLEELQEDNFDDFGEDSVNQDSSWSSKDFPGDDSMSNDDPVTVKEEPFEPFGSSPTYEQVENAPENQEIEDFYSETDAQFENTSAVEQNSTLDTKNLDQSYFEHFGSYVAKKLREVSKKQSIFAEKVIAEVLMRASLGTLQEQTTLTDMKV